MKNLKKYLFLILSFVFCLSMLTACGNKKAPELTKSEISKDLDAELDELGYTYDSIEEFKYEMVETTEEDLNKLKEYFDNKINYQKVDCSFKLKSIKMDITGTLSMMYADVNGEWKVMFSYEKDKEEWEYVPKETVSSKKIMSDLQTIEFEGFEEAYVGTESKTSIKVRDRDTKYNINRDDVYVDVTVKTDFATYVIEVEMIYYFNDGEWELSDAIVQDSKYWQLTYNSDKIPSSPSEENILEQLTKSTNFLTYVANIDFMESHELVETKQLAGVTNITFQYEFITKYKNIGTIKYLVQLPYEWVEGEWSIGDLTVEVSDINVDKMLGTWTSENGDYIEFTKIEKPEKSKFESGNILIGTYYKKTAEDMYSKYTVKCEVNVPLRDNNWEGNIKTWEAVDESSIEYSIKALAIDVQNKQLTSEDLKFNKTADLKVPEKDVEGNEVSEEGKDSKTETSATPESKTEESKTMESKEEPKTEDNKKTGIDG